MEERNKRDKQAIQQLYDTVLPALAQHIHQNLAPVIPMFENFSLERLLDTWTRDPASGSEEKISIENGNIQQLGLRLRLEGFNKAGAEPFDITKDLLFRLEHYGYSVGPDKNNSWFEKEYLQRWEVSEYDSIATKWSDDLIDDITKKLNT